MDRGSGVGGMPPPPAHHQMSDAVGLAAAADPQFVRMRNCVREKILEYIGRKHSLSERRRRLPELARRLEEILYRKFPSKRGYFNMMKGPMEPHLKFAIVSLTAQNRQRQQSKQLAANIISSLGYATTIPTPVITQGASENSGTSYVTRHVGPSSSSAGMAPQNANTGESPDEHVNTLLSLGMNSLNITSRECSTTIRHPPHL